MQAMVSSGDVVGASTKTILCILASATRLAKLKQVILACTDTPADATAIFEIGFISADGTGTGVTPSFVNGLLAAAGAPSCTAKKNYTVEPTYLAAPKPYHVGLNQRVTEIWNAVFDGEMMTTLSGGGAVGIGIRMVSGPALNYAANAQWDE